jgi:6-pyruvoyl-tetrahydropterin synthase
MPLDLDVQKILKEFDSNYDFGFTATDEEEFNSIIAEKENTVDEYKARLEQVEKIIIPFLMKLLKTADQPIIKWPNRKPVLEEQIRKILELTRS